MDLILEALEQVNGDLAKAIEIKTSSRIINEKGKLVKQVSTEAKVDKTAVEGAKDLLETVKSNEKIATKEDLDKLKAKLDSVLAPLGKVDKIAISNEEKAAIDSLKDFVKKYSNELTAKQTAIETYTKKGYDIKDHTSYETNKIGDLQRKKERLNKKMDVIYDVEDLFKDELDEYNVSKEKAKLVGQIDTLIDNFIQNEKEIAAIKDDTSKENELRALLAKRAQYSTEITNMKNEMKNKYGKEIQLPDPVNAREKFEKEAKKIIETEKNETNTQVLKDEAKLKAKIDANKDAAELDAFCKEFGIKKEDITKAAKATDAIKLILDQYSKIEAQRLSVDAEIVKRQETINSLGELDRANEDKADLDKKDNSDILATDAAKNSVKSAVNQKLTDANLIDPKNIKGKDLRKALRETVYKGKRFAGFRSGIRSIFKKSARMMVAESYRNIAEAEYVAATRKAAEDRVSNAEAQRNSWAQKYISRGVVQTLEGKTVSKTDIYQDMDDRDL